MLTQSCAADQAHFHSHSGPGSADVFLGCPTGLEFKLQLVVFRTLALERLRLPLQVSEVACVCGTRLDSRGRHRATERTLTRVCREAGATVRCNTKLRESDCGRGLWFAFPSRSTVGRRHHTTWCNHCRSPVHQRSAHQWGSAPPCKNGHRAAASRAHLRSHSGCNAGAALAHAPTTKEHTIRATPIERVLARVCRLRDMNVDVVASDGRRIEVLAQDLPCFGGAQLAVDITPRCVLTRAGEPHRNAADVTALCWSMPGETRKPSTQSWLLPVVANSSSSGSRQVAVE